MHVFMIDKYQVWRKYIEGSWYKDKIKENIAHIFLAELYFMLLVQTIDG